ncbi:MAG: OB-fold domain-containing protein [Anaerolineae bacterium]|jgi:uncharacterized OB-fold protein|nr:OB-fold domain-containing protein [Anaerolineae bacterium]
MITAYKCKSCGQIMYPYHYRCINCGGREFESFVPSTKAKLLTYTVIEQLPWGFDERGRVLGVVEFSNKVRAMGLIDIDADTEEINIGMKLTATWEPVRDTYGEKIYGLVFRPA